MKTQDSTPHDDNPTLRDNDSSAHKSSLRKAAKIAGFSFLGIIGLMLLAVIALDLWLTPKRISEIIDREASKYLDADLKTGDVSYTLWSSFPDLSVNVDSITVTSRSLSPLSQEVKKELPPDAARLFSARSISASLNLRKALSGDIDVKDITVSHPEIKIVIANDSVNNFSILQENIGKPDMKSVKIGKIELIDPTVIDFADLTTGTRMKADINRLRISDLKMTQNGILSLNSYLESDISGKAGMYELPRAVKLTAEGTVTVGMTPATLSVSNYKIRVDDDLCAVISSDIITAPEPEISKLDANISATDIMAYLPFIPEEIIGKLGNASQYLKGISGLAINLDFSLDSPYRIKSREFPALTGDIYLSSPLVSVPLPGMSAVSIKDMKVDAGVNLTRNMGASSSFKLRNCSFIASDGVALSLSGSIDSLFAANPMAKGDLVCDADLSRLDRSILPSSKMSVTGILKGDAHIECLLSSLANPSPQKMNATGVFNSSSLTLRDPSSGLNAAVSGLVIDLNMAADKSTGKTTGGASVKADALKAASKGNGITASGVDLSLDGNLRSIPYSAPTFSLNPTSASDSILAAEISHTPLYLTPALPPMLQTILGMADINANLSVASASFKTPSYPAVNTLSGLRLSTNTDTLSFSSSSLASGPTQGKIKGKVSNLRAFLTSSSPVPLNIGLEASFSDVDINRLAATYYKGVASLSGEKPDYTVAPLGKMTASDSVCVAIPRNLNANVILKADKAEYMQFAFSPLSTVITLKDGVARLGNLSIGSPFGTAILDWTYNTRDLQKIGMDISLDTEGFSFNKLLAAVPQLKESSPDLADIKGTLSTKVRGSFLMFPSMFLNAPSITASLRVQGDSIMLLRDHKKIRKITNLMMIKGDGPVPVTGLDLQAIVHDNLVELKPFTVDAGGYKVLLGGANNLSGQMYYHAGLLRTPFRLPFGVNIEGTFKHPELRFGGRWIKDSDEERFESNLSDNIDVNIMRQLSHGWLQFVAAAAKYSASHNP